MFHSDLNYIKKIFKSVKKLAQRELQKSNFEKSINYIRIASEIAYKFNWIYKDDDLEENLSDLSEKIIFPVKESFSPVSGRIVFYDVFALYNRGLTLQYLRAIISWDVEILFVFDGYNYDYSNKVLDELKSHKKADFFTVDSNLSNSDRARILYKKISSFKPEIAFLHLHPSSVVASIVWGSLSEVTRFQINLTDHAFWLGINCTDYSLEFRDYGCTVSYEKRGLPREQILKQSFYPILECENFTGFPEELPGDAIKIFSGGAFYKMYGKSGMFFTLLNVLLSLNPKVVILLAGSGDVIPINNFITKFNFQKRIFLLGNRADITHVFQKCDIYLSTYPITGGLMAQYAAKLSKPILSYTSDDISCNFVEGFLNFNAPSDIKITHTEIKSFVDEASRLINDEIYRYNQGQEISKYVISEDVFSTNLKDLVYSKKAKGISKPVIIDYDAFTNLYIESENFYLKQFHFFLIKRFGFRCLILSPKSFLYLLITTFRFYRHLAYFRSKYNI